MKVKVVAVLCLILGLPVFACAQNNYTRKSAGSGRGVIHGLQRGHVSSRSPSTGFNNARKQIEDKNNAARKVLERKISVPMPR